MVFAGRLMADMTFDEIWIQVQGLPETAKLHIPEILSEDTKGRLSEKRPSEAAVIVAEAIEEINHGSVERLDELIQRRL